LHSSGFQECPIVEVPVFYASTEGQTRRIAERMAGRLRLRGLLASAIDVTSPQAAAVDWTAVRGAMLLGSLHIGKHQPAARRLVVANLARLNAVPSAFFSVSMAAAAKNPVDVESARTIASDFPTAAGWRPDAVECVAGRLAYTQYGFITRWLMKRIARKEGGATDTSRDWEYTDWDAVDRFADAFAGRVRARLERAVTGAA
jgi:menaquinone-dependent protoporphyrinogen oxidase